VIKKEIIKFSLEQVLINVSDEDKKNIYLEIDKVYEEIKNLDFLLTKKKNLD